MADIFTLLKDSTNSAALRREFIQTIDSSSPEELCDWMNKKGYSAGVNDCKDLITKRQKSRSSRLYAVPY